MATPEQWAAAGRAAVDALDPPGGDRYRAYAYAPGRRGTLEDDAAEPIVRAYLAGTASATIVLGLTEFTVARLAGGVDAAATAALDGIAAALGLAGLVVAGHGPIRLDERLAAIAPRDGRTVMTFGIDRKLAQLMSTTIAIVDVIDT